MNHQSTLQSKFDISRTLATEIIKLASVSFYEKNTILQPQYTTPSHLFFILSGLAGLFKTTDQQKETYCGIASAGQMTNDLCLILDEPQEPSIRALSEVLVVELPMDAARILYKNNDEFPRMINRSLAEKLKIHTTLFNLQTESSLQKRVCRALITLNGITETNRVPITLTQMAILLNISRNTVTKAIKFIEKQGAIESHYGLLTIKDEKALHAIASVPFVKEHPSHPSI
ncbi:Crp/Fnr family transcriptional regulator [Endozoicomonas sp.]|uniref:Crp/Fnr family transcriptional regulator n=1 Tax=Endozoicomonas sp. TaxID=1892382 RepID=UPI002887BB8D|nr:Crp/Fnr family transcriptional regulator [Endozoicomonas sp.]